MVGADVSMDEGLKMNANGPRSEGTQMYAEVKGGETVVQVNGFLTNYSGPPTAAFVVQESKKDDSVRPINKGQSMNGAGAFKKASAEHATKDSTLRTDGILTNGAVRQTKGAVTGNTLWKKKPGRHGSVGHKSILQSERLSQYILETNTYPREHEQLRELRQMSAEHQWNLMLSPADEGQFLQLILKLMNAKNTIEIGTYTGYSLLATALALPADGKVIAMDLNRDCLSLGWPYIEKAGVANKIDFVEGPALDSLDALLKDETKHNFFDFVFVDADKNNYMKYHERILKLVRVGGLIAYDNTLWNAAVIASEEELDEMPKYIRFYLPFIKELNDYLAHDPRVEPSLLSIGDGVTLCRRVI